MNIFYTFPIAELYFPHIGSYNTLLQILISSSIVLHEGIQ